MGGEVCRAKALSIRNYTYFGLKNSKNYFGVLAAIVVMATASAASAGCLATNKAKCSAAIASDGVLGRTSYTAIPFVSSVYQISWGASPGLAPANLFWENGKNFTNATTMTNARIAAAALTEQGVVPASGAQRWEDTYEASLPASEPPSFE